MPVIAIHQCCAGFHMALVFAPNHKGRRPVLQQWSVALITADRTG